MILDTAQQNAGITVEDIQHLSREFTCKFRTPPSFAESCELKKTTGRGPASKRRQIERKQYLKEQADNALRRDWVAL